MPKSIRKVDAVQMNRMNKIQILSLIRKAGQISRAEIGSLSGLTAPTASRLVDHLVHEDKLVSYVGMGESNGGRPPVIVQFNGKENYIIGIDLGATTIRGVLSDLEANFLMEIQIATDIGKGFDAIMDQIGSLVDKLCGKRDIKKENILGVGIGIPGLVNRKNGVVDFSPDFGWKGVDIRKNLQSRLSLPFIYDNSTRLMALGELTFGEGIKFDNFVVINIGYGIAAGIVIDGAVVKGSYGYAGEFGHITVDGKSDIQCKCGAMGCLEALASGRRIAQLGQEAAIKRKEGLLLDLCERDISRIDAKLVASAALQGDEDAKNIYQEITTYLSIGIATLANLLDPQIIIIGGGVSFNGEMFFDNIRSAVKNYLISPQKIISIMPATFGDYATLTGALSLIYNRIVNFQSLS